jgi:predicted NBD/HSP70 family sugar kinase
MSGPVAFAGVDVGGTWTDGIVVDGSGAVLGRSHRPTNPDGADGIVDTVAEAVAEASASAGAEPAGVGVGIPGQVDPAAGTVRLAMNLRIDVLGFPVGPILRDRLRVPVTLENDVRAAAVGAYEHLRSTSEPGLRSLAYLGIGTGMAAGLVVDGRLHRGRDGMAGEIGHVVVQPDGPRCRCGLDGCLEAVAAGPALQRLWPEGNGRPAEAMFEAATAGDPSARRLTEEVIDRYVQAVQWLAAAWGADLIALGGGIGSIGNPLLEPIRERLAGWAARSELAAWVLPPERVVALPAGLLAGAVGAAALARRRAEALEGTDIDSDDPSGRGE